MKQFNGKAIYNPAGKAGEYSQWACNFHVGCSNGCEYCYCKKGILKAVMGQDKPQLKKCFKDEDHALGVFTKELMLNANDIRKHGLFFTFTSDPMLPETMPLTMQAIRVCMQIDVPVKILTKCTEWVEPFLQMIEDDDRMYNKKNLFAFGFTLTGHDELEKGAATNEDRIRVMNVLNAEGFKTWASIEPIIDLKSSYKMIIDTLAFCDLYKIGLMSGKKYDKNDLTDFGSRVLLMTYANESNIYFKDSFLKQSGWTRESLPSNCVGRDYLIFQ